MIIFTGDQVDVFAMITLKSALSLYAKTGMKANRAYTPTAMMRTASRMTGRTLRLGTMLGRSRLWRIRSRLLVSGIDSVVPTASSRTTPRRGDSGSIAEPSSTLYWGVNRGAGGPRLQRKG